MNKEKTYAAVSPLKPYKSERRNVRKDDVEMPIHPATNKEVFHER